MKRDPRQTALGFPEGPPREPYSLYGGTPPHEQGSETSKAAAESIARASPALRARVEAYLASRGSAGATDNEIELALRMRHQTASARRRELVQLGHVRDSLARRPTDSGRTACVWAIIPESERGGPPVDRAFRHEVAKLLGLNGDETKEAILERLMVKLASSDVVTE